MAATSGNVLSGTAGSAVTAGDTGETVLIAVTDGANVAVMKYVEASVTSVQAGELTVLAVLTGVAATGLTDANFFG
jgi:hypothetical protein